MNYLICWIFPPLAILLCGRPILAVLNLLLCCTIVGIPFACIWGYLIVAEANADRRTNKIIKAVRQSGSGQPTQPAGEFSFVRVAALGTFGTIIAVAVLSTLRSFGPPRGERAAVKAPNTTAHPAAIAKGPQAHATDPVKAAPERKSDAAPDAKPKEEQTKARAAAVAKSPVPASIPDEKPEPVKSEAVLTEPAKPATEKPEPTKPVTAQPSAEAEKAAATKLDLARQIDAAGKKDRAKERYQDIVKQYPGTKAAAEAAKLLEGQ